MKFSPKTEKEVAAAGLFPKGIYDFEVVEATDKVSKSGNDMVELNIKIYDKEGRSRKVFDWLVDTDGGAYKIRHFAEAAGLLAEYEKGSIDAEMMLGRTGRCDVAIRKDKDGQYPDKNVITDYLKSDGTVKVPAEMDDEIPFD